MCVLFSQLLSVIYQDVAAWITAIFTVVIALATIAYVILTYGLWTNSAKTLEETRNSFIRLNNPQVALSEIKIETSRSDSADFGIMVGYNNYGPTIARNVRFIFLWGNIDELRQRPSPKTDVTPYAIPPQHQMYHFSTFGESQVIDGQQYDNRTLRHKFFNGELPLYVKCEIYYEGLDGEDYLYYYYGLFNPKEKDFYIVANYAGKVIECKETLSLSSQRRSLPQRK